ncbi:MAG: hypothetical protein VW683_10015 [Betaproteobacteria bacterium]
MGNVHEIMIMPFSQSYGKCPDPIMERIVTYFRQFDDDTLLYITNRVLENYTYQKFPVVAQIAKYLPQDAIDKTAGQKLLDELAEKETNRKRKAHYEANQYISNTRLGELARQEGWDQKLRRVVYNLEWIREQIAAKLSGVSYDATELPISYEVEKIDDYVQGIREAFAKNIHRTISFSEEAKAYMSGFKNPKKSELEVDYKERGLGKLFK